MKAITTENLTKKYKDLIAVNGININVEEGELYALLGVNGAGKTTTIKMLSCLTKPDGGDATVLGHSIVHDSVEVKKIIGVSPQETAIAPNLSVKENLELMCGIYGFSKDKTKAKVDELARDFNLDTILTKRAGKLSGGWKRRLSIALALVSEPKILFLDEPTLGLDVLARNELWEKIRALKGSMTIILTTHNMGEAESLSDHIAIMKDGVVLSESNLEDLLAKTSTTKLEDAFVNIVTSGGAL